MLTYTHTYSPYSFIITHGSQCSFIFANTHQCSYMPVIFINTRICSIIHTHPNSSLLPWNSKQSNLLNHATHLHQRLYSHQCSHSYLGKRIASSIPNPRLLLLLFWFFFGQTSRELTLTQTFAPGPTK